MSLELLLLVSLISTTLPVLYVTTLVLLCMVLWRLFRFLGRRM